MLIRNFDRSTDKKTKSINLVRCTRIDTHKIRNGWLELIDNDRTLLLYT